MIAEDQAGRTRLFVNWAHALDHYVLLIFPTAVIAIGLDLNRRYDELIWLSTGAFIAFGLFALPVGWLADRFGRRSLLAWFFFGYGVSCLCVAASSSLPMLTASLLLLGIFSAIYHPIGSAMIVANTTSLGRSLGINGTWGNLGAAFASGITAAIAAAASWRAAFILPGVILILSGFAFVNLIKEDRGPGKKPSHVYSAKLTRNQIVWLCVAFGIAILAGGFTFNIVTISMPKVIDERFGYPIPLAITGWMTTGIFICGALTQITVGKLIDRVELPVLFVALAIMQPLGMLLAAEMTGAGMMTGLILVIAAIYGQVVVNDAMIGRYVPDKYRNRAYSVRFFVGFTLSGLAVPLIARLHSAGGFPFVLLASAGIGTVILAAALFTWALTRGRLQVSPFAAE